MNNHYRTLGVSEQATASDIKKAFRLLAHQHHPDKHATSPPSKQQEEANIFKALNDAHGVLSNPEKKTAYDNFRKNGRTITAHARPPNGTTIDPIQDVISKIRNSYSFSERESLYTHAAGMMQKDSKLCTPNCAVAVMDLCLLQSTDNGPFSLFKIIERQNPAAIDAETFQKFVKLSGNVSYSLGRENCYKLAQEAMERDQKLCTSKCAVAVMNLCLSQSMDDGPFTLFKTIEKQNPVAIDAGTFQKFVELSGNVAYSSGREKCRNLANGRIFYGSPTCG